MFIIDYYNVSVRSCFFFNKKKYSAVLRLTFSCPKACAVLVEGWWGSDPPPPLRIFHQTCWSYIQKLPKIGLGHTSTIKHFLDLRMNKGSGVYVSIKLFSPIYASLITLTRSKVIMNIMFILYIVYDIRFNLTVIEVYDRRFNPTVIENIYIFPMSLFVIRLQIKFVSYSPKHSINNTNDVVVRRKRGFA